MRVFVTGASGFVGSAVVAALLAKGHQVLGLARSAQSAEKLAAAGAEVLLGDLSDSACLMAGASQCDGVIHTGFNHDFSKFVENCEMDRQAIVAMAEAMAGSNKPLLVTSGVGVLGGLGRTILESDRASDNFPRKSEQAADEALNMGVKAMVIRLAPSTHGEGDHGFVPILISLAREKGFAGYVGDGGNRWCGVHRLDAADLFVLALEKGEAGARYHAVAESEVAMKAIAGQIAKGLGLEAKGLDVEAAREYFTWFEHFASFDAPSSNRWTCQQLGWQPTRLGLLDDIAKPYYYR
ncbi:SDR family oxidoreductase [Gallaecimonas mangrovi]|uniref:SDR family oxidoreductase n=1 Tax=Gallaecimonas mangrovi TaxID=2291597 RepID=UPI000E20109E|nr:SDR family oxidoreductase [Gallaecimonas mangrovi]